MTEIGNYTIIKQLGEGGMAKVYLAEHKTLGHKVAIKVLAKEFVFNQGIKSRFIDEAKKMVRMTHPNVVTVTDLINVDETVAIVMEYVDGKTLREILHTKKLTNIEIDGYLKQMVSALSYVHNQGLVHRDVKPANFIFNSRGILKLADFGISKNLINDLDNHTKTSMSMGTPMYMSPEQIRSTKDVSHLSDIYSLGVVLWEMIAGKKPFELNTLSDFDLMTKVVNEPLDETHTKWDKVIQKATQKEEKKRFQSVDELLLAIDNSTHFDKLRGDSSAEVDETGKSVPDFEKTIITQKPVIKKVITENRSDKTFFQKVKGKKYLLLAGVLLISIFIIIFQCNNTTDALKEASPQEAIKKAEYEAKAKAEKQAEDEAKAKAEKQAEDEAKAKAEKQAEDEAEKKKVAEEKNKKLIVKKPAIEFIRIGNLEVMTKDIGKMNWWDAKKACEALGDGWRLPTVEELKFLRVNQTIIGGFASSDYWSSSEYSASAAHYVGFYGGSNAYGKDFDGTNVRAVRSF